MNLHISTAIRERLAVVVTSISPPNKVLRELAAGCERNQHHFIVVGDAASPADFVIDGCDFYGIRRQLDTDLTSARCLPTRHYSRKNVGYLLAVGAGADVIVETDDDNLPYAGFPLKPNWQAAPPDTTADSPDRQTS